MEHGSLFVKERNTPGRAKNFQPIGAYTPMAGNEFIGAFALPGSLLPAQAEAVGNHGDEFAIGGLAFDVADRVAEKLLQHLDVAPVPGYFNGMADFQGFALKEESLFSSEFFIVFSK